ncbi:MAG TPA: uridine phosphorylase, partial [Deltaproteobacteria bacterium]|nr:uridine phosphorylase [Deltaproteobacteria bacterium]
MPERDLPPILREKDHRAPSAFTPESLLREARRQKAADFRPVPEVCILDPDGDIVRRLKSENRARLHRDWVCYHTELHVFEEDGMEFGIIGCAVGSSFAVLLAEELFVSGCQLLINLTSSGQLLDVQPPPYFILVDRAYRDEGTSYHYLPPSDYCEAPSALLERLEEAFGNLEVDVLRGATWTTD